MFNTEENWLLKEKYHGKKTSEFENDCLRLSSGVPLAYLIGYIPFLNCKIWLDSKPLIPRPETEFWVEKVLAEVNYYSNDKNKTIKILDLCAGSGCIGIAIAKNNLQTRVDFIELDKHQQTITKNCLENNIGHERFKVFHGDLFLPLNDEKYDFILSNPPYIDKNLNRVDNSVKENEPALALYGGNEGVEIIARIINESPRHLKPGGRLWLEHEPEQIETINNLAKNKFHIINYLDQYQVQRFSQLVLQ